MTLDLISKGGDPETWRIYAMTISKQDIQLYINIYQGIQEYEICQIMKEELEKREQSEQ